MTEIDIGWVRAGNRDGAHGVVETNLDSALAAEIARRTDFPGNLPNEVGQAAIVSLGYFTLASRLVIYEIGSDERAQRAGMAASGAVAIEWDAAENLVDLKCAIDATRALRMSDTILKTLEIDRSDVDEHMPTCAPLIDHLFDQDVLLPIECDQASVLRSLWTSLPSGLLRSMKVRLCFAPNDIASDGGVSVGFVPRALKWAFSAEKWLEEPFEPQGEKKLSALATNIASGNAGDLFAFADENEIHLSKMVDLDRLERVIRRLGGNPSTAELIGTLRFVQSLKGGLGKTALELSVAKSISDTAASWSFDDVRTLRNVTVSSDDERATLSSALQSRTIPLITSLASTDNATLFSDVFDERCKPWWRESFRRSLRCNRKRLPESIAKSVWDLAGKKATTAAAAAIVSDLQRADQMDETLAKSLKHSHDFDIDTIFAMAPLNHFPMTVSRGLLLFCSIDDAVRRVMVINDVSTRTAVLRALCEQADGQCVCDLAGYDEGVELTHGVAERLAAEPVLLAKIDISVSSVQRAAAAALAVLSSTDDASISAFVDRALRFIATGSSIELEFNERLGERSEANAIDMPERQLLWDSIEEPAKTAILRRTAGSWLERIGAKELLPAPEPSLRKVLIHEDLLPCREAALFNVGLAGWNHLASFESSSVPVKYRDCLLNIVGNENPLRKNDVARMGIIIRDRQWSSLATALVSKFHSRQDLGPAWPSIMPLLHVFERCWLPSPSFTKEEVDGALRALLSELYYGGPGDGNVWERAGGDLSEVVSQKSGADQWTDAMRKVRSGHRVSRCELLRVASVEFPNNANLRQLKRILSC